MLTVDQITKRAARLYSAFLRSVMRGESIFPLDLIGGGMERPTDFTRDQVAIAELRASSREVRGFGYAIEWKEQTSRRFGGQRIPAAITIPTREDFTRLLAKCEEVRLFEGEHQLIATKLPELLPWAESHPLRIIEHAGLWRDLMEVCGYLREHGPVRCYPRELPVSVDTKFIERNAAILTELLPLAAPACLCDDLTSFESRFGFRKKQLLIRFRLLDTRLRVQLGIPFSDFAIPLDEAMLFHPPVRRVVIVENEMTFLTLPPMLDSLAIFGSGYGVAALQAISWLSSIPIVYWGDLDAHGFAALSHLRKTHGHVESILMDVPTLDRYRPFAVPAKAYGAGVPANLNSRERDAFDVVHAAGLSLEQERIPHADVTSEFGRLSSTF